MHGAGMHYMNSVSLSVSEKIARLRLIRTDSIGPITFRHLISRFGTASDALEGLHDIASKGGRKKPLKIPPKSAAEKELQQVQAFGGTALFLGDSEYPSLLSFIDDAPPVLFTKGHTALFDKETIGIVGARNASAAGIKLTRSLSAGLSDHDIVTASGMARGIDTAAHVSSFKAGTLACLAGGLDIVYPRENQDLYDRICDIGLIISEMPLGTKPQARHFPRRNRLISGLSRAVLVIEAAEKSGSLITARMALEQNREVLAIPGSPLDPRAGGTNKLIREGATLVTSVADIISELRTLAPLHLGEPSDLPLFTHHTKDTLGSDMITQDMRSKILSLLSPSPIPIDDVVRLSDLDTEQVLTIILELEIAGNAIRHTGGRVSLLL